MRVLMYHQTFSSNTANINPSHPSPGAGSATNATPSKPASPTPARTGHLKDILAPAPAPELSVQSPPAQTQTLVANIAPQIATSTSMGGPIPSAQTSPNTVYASPQTAQPSPVSNPGQPLVKRSEPGRMRASIACGHCRRSKIKCENPGQQQPCKGCLNAGRSCVYGPSESTGHSRRQSVLTPRGDASNMTTSSEAPKPKRSKKTHTPSFEGSHAKGASNQFSAILDPQLLTISVWEELIDIFLQHYSVDFQFFHPLRFKKNLNQVPVTPAFRGSSPPGTPDQPLEFLLAFLALTARFHDKIRAHYSPGDPDDWVTASEHFASEARARLDRRGPGALPTVSLVRAQACLMLAMHEHVMGRGEEAYIDVGRAIEQVYFGIIHYDQDLDGISRMSSTTQQSRGTGRLNQHSHHQVRREPDEEERVDQEIRRRTLWSCFLMDKYISNGKYRPYRFTVDQFNAQLPGTSRIFSYGHNVKTKLLNEDTQTFNQRFERFRTLEHSAPNSIRSGDKFNHKPVVRVSEPIAEIDHSEGRLAQCIRALDLYGRINLWCCMGGRKSGSQTEQKIPPWDPESKAYQFGQELADIEGMLPVELHYSDRNTLIQSNEKKTSTAYIIIHLVLFLGNFLIHREYLPCHPWESICPRPKGPIEGPLFDAPPDPHYWEESARRCFGAARDIQSFLHRCRDLRILPETPFIAFCAWSATFAGIYSWVYPHMDQGCPVQHHREQKARDFLNDPYSAFSLVNHFARRMPMAKHWCKIAEPMASTLRGLVDRENGGGQTWFWDKYKKDLADLTACDRAVHTNGVGPDNISARDVSPREDITTPSVKSEAPETPSAWNAVNTRHPVINEDNRTPHAVSGFQNGPTPATSHSIHPPYLFPYPLESGHSGPNVEKGSDPAQETFEWHDSYTDDSFDLHLDALAANCNWQYRELYLTGDSAMLGTSFVKHAVDNAFETDFAYGH